MQHLKDYFGMVFRRQPLIYIAFLFTNNSYLQNECSWLLISPQTEEYDIVELAAEGSWRYEQYTEELPSLLPTKFPLIIVCFPLVYNLVFGSERSDRVMVSLRLKLVSTSRFLSISFVTCFMYNMHDFACSIALCSHSLTNVNFPSIVLFNEEVSVTCNECNHK